MERDTDHDAHLAALHRNEADIRDQIRLSKQMIEQSQELLRRTDEMLAKSQLKP
jgi:hypothetical protein